MLLYQTIKPVAAAIVLGLPAVPASAQEAIDTLYTNGRIYTVDESQPWAEALAVTDGKFVAIGSATEMAALASGSTKVVDLEGKFVMPGLVDTHTHPFISALTILSFPPKPVPVHWPKEGYL